MKTKNPKLDYKYLYTLDSIQNIQVQLDKKLAKQVNRFRASKKNDLSLCNTEEDVWRLSLYKNILEQISDCNPCFKEFDIKQIIGSVKAELSK